MKQTIEERIRQRRLQILIHSYIYYELSDSVVSDAQWSRWAQELVELQRKHPNTAEKVDYHDQFVDFDGSTGMHFVYDDFIESRAALLLSIEHDLRQLLTTVGKTAAQRKQAKLSLKKKKTNGRKLF